MRHECPHAAGLTPPPAPLDVCEVCIEEGSTWVHLRQCLTCYRTLCCDDSPRKHMSAHARATQHPLMRTVEPGEAWIWCFADNALVRQTEHGWETYDGFVEAGIHVFGGHVQGGGSPDIGDDFQTERGFPLGPWAGYVRELRGSGDLDPSDAAAIEALPGWRW